MFSIHLRINSIKQKTIIPSAKKHQITSVVHNISGKPLSPVEINVLERGLNFALSTKHINKDINPIHKIIARILLHYHFP